MRSRAPGPTSASITASATASKPRSSGILWILGVAVLLPAVLVVSDAQAQRPFPVNDPFYRSETARKVFHDGLAATGEVAYRAAGPVPGSGIPTSGSPLSLAFRLHYRMAERLDLNAFWDAAGTATGRTIVLSWVGLKYYWTVDNSDYAFRLAVDPATDGRVGFPQLDVAFISTKALTPLFSTDFAVGVRRVRKGYRQFLPAAAAPSDAEDALLELQRISSQFIDTRALGMELHFMWTYNVIFDPARSNLFLAMMGEGGQYTLVETRLGAPPAIDEENGTSEYRGGVIWARSGIEFNRPSYQVIPFLSVPLKQWAPEEGDQARMQLGVRLMLR